MYTTTAKLVRWGNSYGIRFRKQDVEKRGLREGSLIDVSWKPHKGTGKVDLSDLPTFKDPDPLLSQKVDEILYGEKKT